MSRCFTITTFSFFLWTARFPAYFCQCWRIHHGLIFVTTSFQWFINDYLWVNTSCRRWIWIPFKKRNRICHQKWISLRLKSGYWWTWCRQRCHFLNEYTDKSNSLRKKLVKRLKGREKQIISVLIPWKYSNWMCPIYRFQSAIICLSLFWFVIR